MRLLADNVVHHDLLVTLVLGRIQNGEVLSIERLRHALDNCGQLRDCLSDEG